jgi:hypothetical protein
MAIDQAADAADRAEQLGGLFIAELAGDGNPAALARLSAEMRACNRTALELVRTVATGLAGPTKSARHVAAVKSRWDRQPNRGA